MSTTQREESVFLAKLAEQAERYEGCLPQYFVFSFYVHKSKLVCFVVFV